MEAELILAAIQAALKLYAGIRKAFVDATRDRPLLLPLPRAPELTIEMVLDYPKRDLDLTAARNRGNVGRTERHRAPVRKTHSAATTGERSASWRSA